MGLEVKLQVFEGPLDLLLHLIDKNKIDIYDIPIVEITNQYMEYIHAMEKEDLNIMSEFLLMAATLLDIKCRMLLPREVNEEGEEEDPRRELVEQLLQYKMYKYISYELKDRQLDGERSLYRAPDVPREVEDYVEPVDLDALLDGVTLAKLNRIFREMMRRQTDKIDPIRSRFGKIEKEEVSLPEKLADVELYAREHRTFSFRELLAKQPSRVRLVVTFLAVLELMKTGKITIRQEQPFDDIRGHPLHIPVHGVTDLLLPSVLSENPVDPPGKFIQIQLIQLIVQQPGGLQHVQLSGGFLVDKADAGKTVAALPGGIKHTAAGTHLPQLFIFLEKQQAALKALEISLNINVIKGRKHLGNTGIVLTESVLPAHLAFPVGHEGKGQLPLLKRRKLSFEILQPRLISPVLAVSSSPVQPYQILLLQRHPHRYLYIGKILLEILCPDGTGTQRHPDGIQNRRFPRIVFSHQNQRPLNIPDPHVPDQPVIPDPYFRNPHIHSLPAKSSAFL